MNNPELDRARIDYIAALHREQARLEKMLAQTSVLNEYQLKVESNLSERQGLLDAQNYVLSEMERSGSSESLRIVYNHIADRVKALQSARLSIEAGREQPKETN